MGIVSDNTTLLHRLNKVFIMSITIAKMLSSSAVQGTHDFHLHPKFKFFKPFNKPNRSGIIVTVINIEQKTSKTRDIFAVQSSVEQGEKKATRKQTNEMEQIFVFNQHSSTIFAVSFRENCSTTVGNNISLVKNEISKEILGISTNQLQEALDKILNSVVVRCVVVSF
ncbi:hypothetical protein FF38_08411 [Lucilia cuprina]|uniref:Uncharacterized protein n=1 Tax=Lucilia cuprina TaxID=7375 RepID=A0A0L0BMW7_LUCCU|nr:hypothetical protein FF38_08411 [Lucilia cuprina]